MRRIFIAFALVLMVFFVVACGGDEEPTATPEPAPTATTEPTAVPEPTATPEPTVAPETAAVTETVAMTETAPVTDTAAMTETAAVTESVAMTETAPVTTTSPVTATTPVTTAAVPAPTGPEAPAEIIAIVTKATCFACHVIPGVPTAMGQVGPNLTGIGTAAATRIPGYTAEQYIHESIVNPNAFIAPKCPTGDCLPNVMLQTLAQMLTPEEIDTMVAYLVTLK